MKRIPRSQALVTALDATLPPALTVAAGEQFAVGTEDASHGLLRFGEVVGASVPRAAVEP